MDRRGFIKTGCKVCLLGAAGIMLPGLVNFASAKGKNGVYKTKLTDKNQLEIPLSLFEETNLKIISVKGWDYDLALHKKEDGMFAAILMRCTHMENQLNITGEGFQCSLHGSLFDKDGNVLKGPAEQPLTQYKAEVAEQTIIISA